MGWFYDENVWGFGNSVINRVFNAGDWMLRVHSNRSCDMQSVLTNTCANKDNKMMMIIDIEMHAGAGS